MLWCSTGPVPRLYNSSGEVDEAVISGLLDKSLR